MAKDKKLLIVESPAKAKTIAKYLGAEFVVKSSVGHIRDLPQDNKAIKIVERKAGEWSFEPTYEISEGKKKVVTELKTAVKDVAEIYLASDPDREGEAIAWHLKEVLSPVAGEKCFHRVTYNEITPSAVRKAVASPRDIDMPLVDAQQARRILDRLVGYKVSPLLWRNISCADNRSLSAGRVQSVALRLLVERQREIDAFKSETYFLLGVEAAKRTPDKASFVARLAKFDGAKADFRDRLTTDNALLDLADAELEVVDLKSQAKTRHALPPFTTSTLQQTASSVLGMSPGTTMKAAQALYERGQITYMRTDSVNVSPEARAATEQFIVANYGAEFYPEKPNVFKSRESAQEAHEAIRPTDVTRTPETMKDLDPRELKLYDLIWRRFVASQMADAKTTLKTVLIEPRKEMLAHTYVFTASATEVDFEGFLKVMRLSLKKKTKDGEDDEDTDEVAKLPPLAKGERLSAVRYLADEKQTKGPAHYSEASLIKALEENGVGRPSTYAATIETLKVRKYAKTEKRKLVPLERGILVCDWLVKKLEKLFNVGYTAKMEGELDKVERGGVTMNAMLSDFYGKFQQALKDCIEPAPDRGKFDAVFKMLGEVSRWNEPKKVGARVYDDKAFVESVREQAEKGIRPLSARQLDYLVRMVLVYADQIPDSAARLKELGLAKESEALAERADPELVKWCFSVVDRIGDLGKNVFIKSLRDQFDRKRPLSPKQLAILAKTIGENSAALEDCAEIRERLTPYVAGGFEVATDPTLERILELMKGIKEWRPAVKRGRKTYDDHEFVKSLTDQFARRRSLSPRQAAALRRLAMAYRTQVPEFEREAQELGLKRAE